MLNTIPSDLTLFTHFDHQESGLFPSSVISWYNHHHGIDSTLDGSPFYTGQVYCYSPPPTTSTTSTSFSTHSSPSASSSSPSSSSSSKHHQYHYHPYAFPYHSHGKLALSHTLDHPFGMSGWVQNSDTCLEFDATHSGSDSPPTTAAGPSFCPSSFSNDPVANPPPQDGSLTGYINHDYPSSPLLLQGAPPAVPPLQFPVSMTTSPQPPSPTYTETSQPETTKSSSDSNEAVVVETKYANRTCQICHKRFDRPSTLKKHMVVHTHSQPYHCTLCPARFGVKSNLSRHIRHSHSNTTPSTDTSSPTQPRSRPRTRARSLTAPSSTKMPSMTNRRRSRPRATSMPPVPTTLRRFRTMTADQCQRRVVPVAVPTQRCREGFYEDLDESSDEERNSWDMDVDEMMPYHPVAYRGTLPGPNALRVACP